MTYWTLGRGKPNHHQLDGLDGRWLKGHVNGMLVDAGCGASVGYPALVLQADGPAIDVEVFESADLPDHWARLDDFEGDGSTRCDHSAYTDWRDRRIHLRPCAGPKTRLVTLGS